MSNSKDKFLKENAPGCDENTFKSLLQFKEICNKEILEIHKEYSKRLLEQAEYYHKENRKVFEENRKAFESCEKLIFDLIEENKALKEEINALKEKNNN